MQIESKRKKRWIQLIVVVILLIVAFGLHRYLDKKPVSYGNREVEFADNVSFTNEKLKKFKEKFPEANVILACEEDVTDDGYKDLVVIYKQEKLTRMVVAIDYGDGKLQYSDPVPAPIEHQGIQFKNIDNEGPVEFIVSGEKKGAVGYAIYRMIEGQPSDLFGDGMEDCC
ncbi:Cys-Cys-COOH (seleno)protein SaoC [Lachnospiraceae bacterium LCP25S3_G4]